MMGEESKLGELLDPIADKIIVATALILLVMDGTIRNYEVIAAIIILTREILISGLREFLAKGKIKLPVSNLSKLKTVLQMVAIGLLLFAFSTAIAWSYYGDRSAAYVFGEKSVVWYRLIYVGCFFIAAVIDTEVVWNLAYIIGPLVTIPNVIALLVLRKEIKSMSDSYVINK